MQYEHAIQFSKSFERTITINAVDYTLSQQEHDSSITITQKDNNKLLYRYDGQIFYVYYEDEDIALVSRIFNQAHFDRYPIKAKTIANAK
jgi:hypothetical protein